MFDNSSRRDFLRDIAILGGAAFMTAPDLLAGMGAPRRRAHTPLPSPKFYWGVGVENCWIAQVNPAKDGTRRLLDVLLQMQHYEKWKQDLQIASDIGVNCIRYSVPWYKSEPKPGVYDWSWIDGPIDFLVNKAKIIPIMDLIHYGTPAWMPDGVIDARYPEALGAYAGAMASHFKGLVNHYSPQNEPQLTCLFCGLTGRWPPYHQHVDSWSKIGLQVAKAMVLETKAIRSAISDAVIVSVDPIFLGNIDQYLPKGSDQDPVRHNLRMAAGSYPACLAYGMVEPGDAFGTFLAKHGVRADEIAWVRERAQKPDIVGYNFYPDIFPFAKDGDFSRHGSIPLEQAAREAAEFAEAGLRASYAYFQMPTYLTETSAGLKAESKVAYMKALYEVVLKLRHDDVPIRGVNWWPLFDTIQWDYREDYDKPLASFIRPGGWNNGLYVIDVESQGDLKRVRTPAAQAYTDIIRSDAEYWKTTSHKETQ